jgi:hypothetical protein
MPGAYNDLRVRDKIQSPETDCIPLHPLICFDFRSRIAWKVLLVFGCPPRTASLLHSMQATLRGSTAGPNNLRPADRLWSLKETCMAWEMFVPVIWKMLLICSILYGRGCWPPYVQTTSWKTTPCRLSRLLIQYIRSYHPYLEVVSSSWGSTIRGESGPTWTGRGLV